MEPLAHTGPVNTRSGLLSPSYFISSYYFLKTGEEQVGERLRVQSVQQAAILQQVQQQGQEEETRVQDDAAAETLQVRGADRKWNYDGYLSGIAPGGSGSGGRGEEGGEARDRDSAGAADCFWWRTRAFIDRYKF